MGKDVMNEWDCNTNNRSLNQLQLKIRAAGIVNLHYMF